MKTLRLKLDAFSAAQSIEHASAILRRGGIVAFPTETVYGLGGNALDVTAVEKIFAAKQRPQWDPLIVHVSSGEMMQAVAQNYSAAAEVLMRKFWPGPLTLLLPRREIVPDSVTAGRPLVGVRMPSYPVARKLIEECGFPLAAPSANRFGHVSPTTAEHVLADLEGRIDAILDSGEMTEGLESTVLDPGPEGGPAVLYRPGMVSRERIEAMIGPVKLFSEDSNGGETAKREALPSPGVGIRHYAPRARLLLVEGNASALDAACRANLREGFKAGVMLPAGWTVPSDPNLVVFSWGEWEQPESLAHSLYDGLRTLDREHVAVVICPVPLPLGLGAAIADRLRKAARAR